MRFVKGEILKINKILHLAIDAGKIMLESGAETYRVEETILRICESYDVNFADTFVTPTVIILSVTDENDQTISLIKRIKSRSVDLEKISEINDLSRKISSTSMDIQQFKTELDNIKSIRKYAYILNLFFSCLGAGTFTLLYGGDYKDFIITFFIGGLVKLVVSSLNKAHINDFFINASGGSITALIALISVHFKFGSHVDKIIIGSIMLLVPGLSITNAIRDTIAGDLLAGISRALEAFLIAAGIAVGTGIILKLWLNYIGGIAL
jgi:uncharacterized membrane protein YjjP (DUF1212 family)